jgi:hypothetical protein
MRRYGQAALDITVAPGQIVEVFYAPPWHQFSRGRMGFTRQKRPGVGFLLLLVAILVAVIAVSVVLAIAG